MNMQSSMVRKRQARCDTKETRNAGACLFSKYKIPLTERLPVGILSQAFVADCILHVVHSSTAGEGGAHEG